MTDSNPYKSPSEEIALDANLRRWQGGSDSVLAARGLLQRKVIINKPVKVTIEYFARGLRDRILVDGKTVASVVPVLWFQNHFDFEIPYCDGKLPASIRLKIGRFLRISQFEILINGVVAYYEENGETRLDKNEF